MFSLVRSLPSPASAELRFASLFGWFTGTMPRSDSSPPCAPAVRLIAFSGRPAESAGGWEVSRFSCMLFLGVPRAYDYGGFSSPSRIPVDSMLPSPWSHKVGIPTWVLEAQSPGPPMPLSTLPPPPRDGHGKTRGQDGSLFLSCRALSSPATCRFIPALGPAPQRSHAHSPVTSPTPATPCPC